MSRYTVYITPQALQEVKELPGYMRQRVKKVIDKLENSPHPAGSKELQMPQESLAKLWRVRLDKWRIVYAITEADLIIDVLAVRKRPPYDYGDLEAFLAEI